MSRAGFVKWFADFAATNIGVLPPSLIVTGLIGVYFLSHY